MFGNVCWASLWLSPTYADLFQISLFFEVEHDFLDGFGWGHFAGVDGDFGIFRGNDCLGMFVGLRFGSAQPTLIYFRYPCSSR